MTHGLLLYIVCYANWLFGHFIVTSAYCVTTDAVIRVNKGRLQTQTLKF